jgi:hypothetical protein
MWAYLCTFQFLFVLNYAHITALRKKKVHITAIQRFVFHPSTEEQIENIVGIKFVLELLGKESSQILGRIFYSATLFC